MRFRLQKLFRKHKPHRSQRVCIKVRDGQFHIVGLGAWYSYWRDPYHLLLTIPWTGFLLLAGVGYIATNAIFALAYLAGGNCIENARPGSFLDVFFFSVQTLASIGYGALYPKTLYANIVVTIEAMAGLMGIAVTTGLAFARFSRPTARVLFSRVAVITPHDGEPTLMFRTANQRRNLILEAQMRVYMMRDEMTLEGDYIRRIYDLKLRRNQSPSFTLTWLAMHTIDEYSPLFGMTAESLVQSNTTLVISVSGIDETVAQVVHARHTYGATQILWNYQFVNIMHDTEDGNRYIDYQSFHDVLSLDEVS
ncbi:ion channel [Nostoc sp. 106C]|uniref:ion channel n=1 Tax=Nostoc sp. 106C TaxID=1932667 RepID=UPI000A3C06A1|nr:ion channel [Nostoc sp. 106C]OUL19917.1 ATP-sensitive inward rectifier potassium channel 10 [Nostoc sp. 106C]OUL22643.1 ATP-sensitive inward rectifier potassium channel 10 [Nostoc sp. RF31YmG]